MPRWGRPPGARLGRQTGGRVAAARQMWDDVRVAEVDEEDDNENENVRRKQLATMDRNQRGGWGWDDDADEIGPVDGVEYDLHDGTDSTVAYAVQLALKDEDEWLVERALERIRRAQGSGQRNVRLSKRELEAFERKRMRQANRWNNDSEGTTTRRGWQAMDSPAKGVNGKTSPRRSGSGASQNQGLVADGRFARSTGALPQPSSPQRPRTPTARTLRPQHSDASLQGRSAQLPSYLTPVRTSGFPRRSPGEREISNNPFHSAIPVGSDSENNKDQKVKDEEDSGDEVQIIDVVQRRVPASPPRRGQDGRRAGR